MMYGYGYGGEWFGHTLFGGFFMIFVWLAVILLVFWLIRELSGKSGGESTRNDSRKGSSASAFGILKERYAKGEITKEQFESMKKDIES